MVIEAGSSAINLLEPMEEEIKCIDKTAGVRERETEREREIERGRETDADRQREREKDGGYDIKF